MMLETNGMNSPRRADAQNKPPAEVPFSRPDFSDSHSEDLVQHVPDAVSRTRQLLLDGQHAEGFWCGELEGDTILESEYILLLAFLSCEDSPIACRAAAYLIEKQLPDGGWSLYPGGPAEVSCSVKAYFALKLTGHDAESEPMRRAKAAILKLGGADSVNSFSRFYLAMLGQISYEHCPAVPPEAILLPTWLPVNIYRVSAWSRTILVPLSIVWAHRPVRRIDDQRGIKELFVEEPEKWSTPRCADLPRRVAWFGWDRFFRVLDSVLKWMERRRVRPLRRRALSLCEEWMVKRFVASDGLGAIFPPIVWSIIALKCLGYSDDSLEVRYCHEQLEGLILEEEDTVRFQPCKSPVWDTALSLRALARANVNSAAGSIRNAITWLLDKEVTRLGDWSHTVRADPGGWYFEHHNDHYPDVDDTAMVLMALGEQFADSQLDDSKSPSGVSFLASDKASDVHEARQQVALLDRAAAACERGRRWVLAMQNRDGGWGAFDKDNDRHFLCYVPFADHNAMIDPSTPDITGRVLEMLGVLGARQGNPVVDRAVTYLRHTQREDGSWYGRWGVNYLYGTWQVVTGLVQIGIPSNDKSITAAADWILAHQQACGGWGESPASYDDSSLCGDGPPTASQTAWALLGLMAADQEHHRDVERGIRFLLDHQQVDGSWKELEFTGTGFPRVFYLRYHMYPLYFPMLALSTWAKRMGCYPVGNGA